MLSPGFLAVPRFLKNNGYLDIVNPRDCPFQLGWETEMTMYEWLQTQPKIFDYFQRYMQSQHKMVKPFTDEYSIEDLLDDLDSEQPFFVDVGGGYGHQALSIKVAYPYARVILEDLPAQLQGTEVGEDVEIVPQDFFEEQKIKGISQLIKLAPPVHGHFANDISKFSGARIYYLRHILCDFPDEICIIILRHLAEAMDEKSVILIDETVMLPTGATYHATLYDFAMMSLFGSKERTKAQWKQLLDKVDCGLKIRGITQYSEEFNYAIVEVVKQP